MANPADARRAPGRFGLRTFLLLAGLAAAGILLHGYHYGFDDQSVYLPAFKKSLDPGLYPFDADFFLLQTRLGIFVDAVAASARLTRLPLEWVVFLWHFASVFLLLAGCWRIARYCFRTPAGVRGGLLLVTVLLTLPVAGTFVVLCDPYLHARAPATAMLLFALADVLERRLTAVVWILLAVLVHPTIALFGIWHVVVQAWPARGENFPARQPAAFAAASLAVWPAGVLAQWFADPFSSAWRDALFGRRYLFPPQWTWYEQLGAFAPLLIFLVFARLARHHGLEDLARICGRLALSGSVGVAAGYAVGLIPALLPLVPLEPMRILHLIYLLLVLLSGGLAAELLSGKWKLCAAALLLPLALGMFFAQRAELDASPHIEWPAAAPRNEWLRAFAWIRVHTPRDALFAMNPEILRLPGENEHGFRGLAERSQLAESAKDRAVARNVPGLAWAWRDQVRAQQGIEEFDLARLQDLRRRYGVTWLLLWKGAGRAAAPAGLDCPFENSAARVCRAP
ncbi:MAG TPA: hypothetical protein VJW51_09875 [Candidatus Acidoferrales bacterium]|nr:hypothetical protein [Candidatus Acidoferrales bacterium]